MLNARDVGEEAERAFLSLTLTEDAAFEAFYSYVTVDEPAVHLMPLHFLPHAQRGQVDESLLRGLAVAAKLEYARNRWLDEMADHPDSVPKSARHTGSTTLCSRLSIRTTPECWMLTPPQLSSPRYRACMPRTGCRWSSTAHGTETSQLLSPSKNTPHMRKRATAPSGLRWTPCYLPWEPQTGCSNGLETPGTIGRSAFSSTMTLSTSKKTSVTVI